MRPQQLLIALFAITVLVGFSSVSAAEIGLTHDSVKDTVGWDEAAVIAFHVQNNQPFSDTITIRPTTDLWGEVRVDNPVVTLGSGSVATVTATIRAPRDVRIGAYDLQFWAVSGNNPDVKGSDIVRIHVTTELPHVDANFGVPDSFAPGVEPVNIVAKNTGAMQVSGLTGVLESSLLPSPVTVDIGSLDVNEAKLVWESDLSVPLSTAPGPYDFKFSIYQNGEKISEQDKQVEITGKENVDVQVLTGKGFLSTTYAVAIKNIGNVPVSDSYNVGLAGLQRLFVHGSPAPADDSVTGAVYWPYSLSPGQAMTFQYTISYIPMLAALISVLVVLYALGWYYRQEFNVTKELVGAESSQKALRVNLIVKNNSHVAHQNVVLEDFVPTPMKLVREFSTAHPALIKKVGGAVRVVWKFDTIYPGEERVISYNVKSALSILGSVVLPEARVKAKINKQTKIYISNTVSAQGKVNVSSDRGYDE